MNCSYIHELADRGSDSVLKSDTSITYYFMLDSYLTIRILGQALSNT